MKGILADFGHFFDEVHAVKFNVETFSGIGGLFNLFLWIFGWRMGSVVPSNWYEYVLIPCFCCIEQNEAGMSWVISFLYIEG